MAKHFGAKVIFSILTTVHLFFFYQQQVHRISESTSDIACTMSPAYEAVAHKPPVYDYVLVSDVRPKLSSGFLHRTGPTVVGCSTSSF